MSRIQNGDLRIEGEPTEVIGLLKIDSEDFALVRWSTSKGDEAYVPYQFMQKHFPLLLIEYFKTRARAKRYLVKRRSSRETTPKDSPLKHAKLN